MSDVNSDTPYEQNDPFGEDFFLPPYREEIVERARVVREHNQDAVRHFVEVLAWETFEHPDLRKVIIPLLWNWEAIDIDWISEAFFMSVRDVCELAESHLLMLFHCLDCGVQLKVEDRRHLTHLSRSLEAICDGSQTEDHLFDLLCDTCIEQRVQRDEEQRRLDRSVQQARLAESRKLPYAERRSREEWAVLRKQVLRRAGYRCQLCGTSSVQLHVHHNTYANYGKERLEDLIVLCKTCHENFHFLSNVS